VKGVDVEGLVSAVSRWVGDEVGGLRRGVVVLVPPGSSRFEVVKRLKEEKLVDVVYAYKEGAGVSIYRDVEQLAEAVAEEFRRAGDRPVYRVAVVPRSTLEALLLAERLRETKRGDLQVKILYLPRYYAEAAGELEEELRALAEVEHSRLKAVARGEYRGISPKPLQISDREKLKKLLEARKTLEELSPGRLGLRDVLAEAFGKALKAVPGAAAASALGGFVSYVIGNLLGWAAEVTSSKFIEELADSVLEGWGRDGVRDKVAAGIAELLRRAERAAEVLKDAEVADILEAFLDQLALEWGMDAESFTAFVENLALLKRRRIAAEDDLERFKKELAERLKEVYRELEGRLAPLGVVAGVYHVPEQLGVYFGEGEIYVGNVLARDRAVYVDHPAEEALAERLSQRQLVVVRGPKGEGKSVLTKVALAKKIVGDRAVVVEVRENVDVDTLRQLVDTIRETGREPILYFDPSKPGHYPQRPWEGARHRPRTGLEELFLLEAVARDKEVAGVVVLSDDLYTLVKDRLGPHAAVEVRSSDVRFLQTLVESYSGCPAEVAAEVAKEVGKYGDNRALVAALAGDWLNRQDCRREAVAEALRRAQGRAVDFALDYIWYAVLGGDRKKANVYAPLIVLRGLYGPLPVKLAERILIDLGKNSDEVSGSRVVRWFAKWHHSTLEEAIKKAARSALEREKIEPEELYNALLESATELKKRGPLEMMLLKYTLLLILRLAAEMSQLSEEEKRRCAKRAALVLGHALAGHLWLPRRGDLPEEAEAVLDEALDTCVVDDYMTADGMVAPLIVTPVAFMYGAAGFLYLKGAPAEAAKMLQGAARIFSPPVSAANIIGLETLRALVDSWRRRVFTLPETFYALGLAALAAGAEVDEEMADLLLYAASFAMQKVAHTATVLPVLAALRPLGEKAPHRYVHLLAAALEQETPNSETVEYIYDALQQLKSRLLLEREHRWSLVYAIHTYSNLLTKHSMNIVHRLENAVADMCQLYGEVRRHSAVAAPEGGLSAQRLFNTIAGAYVLAAALHSDVLAPLVREHCGLGDLVKEAEAVRSALEEAAARPEELRKISINDEDFAEWVRAWSPTSNTERVIKNLRAWFTYVLARHKLNHVLNDRGELDTDKLEETAKEFEKAADMSSKLEEWENYLTTRSLALRARVLAANSWEELLDKARGFQELWEETKEHRKPTARYLATAAHTLGEYLVYLAASGNKERAEEWLKEWRWLLDYVPWVSVVARLVLKLFGVGEGAKLEEVVDVFERQLSLEYRPALLMLVGRLQKDKALEICKQLSKSEVCIDAVAAASSDQEAVERLKSKIEREAPEAHLLLGVADGKTLVEVLTPITPAAQFVFILLAAVEGRADAVRLHGLLGSARSMEPLFRRLFRAVYENCGDLNSEDCRLALLKLYYLHF